MQEIVFIVFVQVGAAATGPLYTEKFAPFDGTFADCMDAAIELTHTHPTNFATCLDLSVFSGGEPA